MRAIGEAVISPSSTRKAKRRASARYRLEAVAGLCRSRRLATKVSTCSRVRRVASVGMPWATRNRWNWVAASR